jgi:hypothetical protein
MFDKRLLPRGYDRKVLIENAWPSLAGSYPKRGSTVKYNGTAITSTPRVTGLYEFRFGSSTKYVCTCGTEIYKDDGDGTWDEITKSGLNLDATKHVSMCTLNDLLCVFQVGGTAQQWNGSAANTSDLTTGAHTDDAFAVVHEGRVYSAGSSTTPHTVNYTAMNDPTTAHGSIDVYLGDGRGSITGLASGRHGRLYVFKQFGIYELNTADVLYGAGPIVRPLFVSDGSPEGCVSHASIRHVLNDIWFVTNKPAIVSLQALEALQDVRLAEVSLPYEQTFTDDLEADQLANVWATVYGRRNCYLASFAADGQTNNDTIIGCHYVRENECFKISGVNASVMAIMEKGNVPTLFTGDYGGFVYYLDQTATGYQDVTTSIRAEVRIPTVLVGDIVDRWKLHEMLLHFKPQETGSEIDISVAMDGGTSQSLTVSQSGDVAGLPYILPYTLSAAPQIMTREVNEETENSGRYYDITLAQGANEGFEPYGFTLGVVTAAPETN